MAIGCKKVADCLAVSWEMLIFAAASRQTTPGLPAINMTYEITVKGSNGDTDSWRASSVPEYDLSRALEKCEITEYSVKVISYE